MVTQNSCIGAVILAGGNVPPTLTAFCSHRALLRVNDRLMLEYLLTTLHAVPEILDTVVVAPVDAQDELSILPGNVIATGETLVENMQRGAAALRGEQLTHLLFVTGDIPLVTAEGMSDFIHASLASGGALTYPIIPQEACEARFPGAKRTYVKIKEGTFTGGNAIFTEASLLDDKQALIQDLYMARKNPLKLAGILGWATVARMLTGSLTISYLESVATRILQAPIRAIITRHAEIGFDVDKASDLAAVEQALALGENV